MCGETETEMSKQNQNQSQNRQQQQSQNRQNQQAQQKSGTKSATELPVTSRATTMTTVDAAAADNHLTAETRLSGQIRPSFL